MKKTMVSLQAFLSFPTRATYVLLRTQIPPSPFNACHAGYDFKCQPTLRDACFTYLRRTRMPALSEALCLKRAGYSQLKASTCLGAVNIMLFNYILSSLTRSDPCLIESNCTNLVPQKPLLKKTKLAYGQFSLLSLIKTLISTFINFPFFSKHPSFPCVSLQSMKDTFQQSSFRREYLNFHL